MAETFASVQASLERDTDGTLWLSYSWLEEDTLPGNPEQLHAVATHLARSTDGGASFEFVRAVNAAAPSPGNVGLVMHEVSTLARTPDGWEDLWLTYALIPTDTRVEFHYQHTIAATPELPLPPVPTGQLTATAAGPTCDQKKPIARAL